MTDTTKTEATKPSSTYFSSSEWVWFFLVLIFGTILRWVDLAERPLHHDESLHAVYGRYYFENIYQGYYKYDPMLHGPLLYTIVMIFYFLFGVSEWAARCPVAVLGTLLMVMPYLFRKYFSPKSVIVLTTVIAFSPTMIYWSRFLREDYFTIAAFLVSLYGVAVAHQQTRVFYLFAGLGFQFASKENTLVHVAILLGFIVAELLFLPRDQVSEKSILARIGRYIAQHPLQTVIALGLGAFVYCFLMSDGFQYLDGIWNGVLSKKSFTYWWAEHDKERIKGPFLFPFYMFAWYDSIFLIAVIWQAIHLYKSAKPGYWISALAILLTAIGFYARYNGYTTEQLEGVRIGQLRPFLFMKFKDNLDIAGAIIIFFNSILITIYHLRKGEQFLGVLGYAFTSLWFTYSYLGEKVPWLAMYPFMAGVVYLVAYFEDRYRNSDLTSVTNYSIGKFLNILGLGIIALGLILFISDFSKSQIHGNFGSIVWLCGIGFGLGAIGFLGHVLQLYGNTNLLKVAYITSIIFTLRIAIIVNYGASGEATELISQVHTTREARDLAVDIRDEIELQRRGYRPRIYVEGEPVWPMTWYFRGIPEYKFDGNSKPEERNAFFYWMKTWVDKELPPAGYGSRTLKLRGWWVPDYTQMTLRRFLSYAIFHQPWNPTGYSYMSFYRRKAEEPGAIQP